MFHPKKNAIGVQLILTLKDQDGAVVNISSASTKQIILIKPDGTKLTKTASFATDGGDGKIKYVTVSGDLDQAGGWEIEAYVILAGGFDSRSSKLFMTVDPLAEE